MIPRSKTSGEGLGILSRLRKLMTEPHQVSDRYDGHSIGFSLCIGKLHIEDLRCIFVYNGSYLAAHKPLFWSIL